MLTRDGQMGEILGFIIARGHERLLEMLVRIPGIALMWLTPRIRGAIARSCWDGDGRGLAW